MIHLRILDEARVIYEGQAERIHFPGKEGEFEVAEDHMPVLSLLQKGTIHIAADSVERAADKEGSPLYVIPIERGVVKIEGNKVLAVVELK